jgi:hypothetical protein
MHANYTQLERLNNEYRRDLMREAANERLVRIARADSRRPALHRPVLAWTGRRLMATGMYLLSLADSVKQPEVQTYNA